MPLLCHCYTITTDPGRSAARRGRRARVAACRPSNRQGALGLAITQSAVPVGPDSGVGLCDERAVVEELHERVVLVAEAWDEQRGTCRAGT